MWISDEKHLMPKTSAISVMIMEVKKDEGQGMNIEIFKNNEFGEIRGLVIDNEPYFVGKDVATALGYSNPTKAVRDHCIGDVEGGLKRAPIQDSLGRGQRANIIDEGDR